MGIKSDKVNSPVSDKSVEQSIKYQGIEVGIEEDTILYKSRSGTSATDSPFAFFKFLQEKGIHKKHVWVIKSSLQTRIKNYFFKRGIDKNVVFVSPGSYEYLFYLKRAKIIIINTVIDSFFIKQPHQILVNTWHGTPIKKMGYDIAAHPSKTQNSLRSLLVSDILTFSSDMSKNIFFSAYKLSGIYDGLSLSQGTPRDDLTKDKNSQRYITSLFSETMEFDTTLPTVLYAPTWKGTSIKSPLTDIDQMITEILALKESLCGRYNVIIKPHPYVHGILKKNRKLKSIIVDEILDANEILSITDVLITDYSSIFFDFLITNKPIFFYTWDRDIYNYQRGLYLSVDKLPGPSFEFMHDLISAFDDIDKSIAPYEVNYSELFESHSKILENSNCDLLLSNLTDVSNPAVVSKPNDNKIIFLIDNDFDESKLNKLLSFIELWGEVVDFSIMIDSSHLSDLVLSRLSLLSIRYMCVFGTPVCSKDNENIAYELIKSNVNIDMGHDFWKSEAERVLLGIDFDFVVDLSSSSQYFKKILPHINSRHVLNGNIDVLPSLGENIVMPQSGVYHENLNHKQSIQVGLRRVSFSDNKIKVYENLSANSFSVIDAESSEFHSIAYVSVNGNIFNKIIRDGFYVGWTDAKVIKDGPLFFILDDVSISRYALCVGRRRFYSHPVGTNIDAHPVGYLKYYRNYPVYISRKLTTTEGVWFLTHCNDVCLGWAMEAGLSLIKDPQKLPEFNFCHVTKIDDISLNVILPVGSDLWKEPANTPLSKYLGSNDIDREFLATKKVCLTDGTEWYSLLNSSKYVGSVLVSDVIVK